MHFIWKYRSLIVIESSSASIAFLVLRNFSKSYQKFAFVTFGCMRVIINRKRDFVLSFSTNSKC